MRWNPKILLDPDLCKISADIKPFLGIGFAITLIRGVAQVHGVFAGARVLIVESNVPLARAPFESVGSRRRSFAHAVLIHLGLE